MKRGPKRKVDHDAILRLNAEGLLVARIAERLGHSRSTIRYVLRAEGVECNAAPRQSRLHLTVVSAAPALVSNCTAGPAHHWLVDSPAGGLTVTAVCRLCGARREFPASSYATDWDHREAA